MKTSKGILLWVLVVGLAGCDSSGSRGPTPVTTPAPQPAAQLAGTVYDTAGRFLVGARVEVLDGPLTGTSVNTDHKGYFEISGSFDDTTRFRASMSGHLDATATRLPQCTACNPDWWIHFSLESLATPVNVAGDYALTFMADSVCAAVVPEVAQTRSYAATIVPVPASGRASITTFDLTIAGSPLLDGYDRLRINVAGDYISIWLGDLHGDPGLLEAVSENTYVSLAGEAWTTVTDATAISIPFDGVVEFCARKTAMGRQYSCSPAEALAQARCAATNHRLVLTAR